VTAPPFGGVGVALVTLFDAMGEVDAKATAEHAAHLVDLGVRGVVVAGSTGEAAALTAEERNALLTEVRRAVPVQVPVLAGTGAPATRQAVALTLTAVELGADAVLALSPPRVRDPRAYYEAVAGAAGGRPVLAYHYPEASAPGVPVELLGQLPVQGVKDSSGDPERLLAELTGFRGWVYVGSAALLAYAGPLGCQGAILALANARPELCAAAFAGDASAQLELVPSHLATHLDFPHGLKELVASRFGTSRAARLG
jgi:dihydrodipicolinate synthase/N-acetylneuraminate lyase